MLTSNISSFENNLKNILLQFDKRQYTASEALRQIKSVIDSNPNIFQNRLSEKYIHDISEKFFTLKSTLSPAEQKTVTTLFYQTHQMSPRKVSGLLSFDKPVCDMIAEYAELEAIIRGSQNYPISTKILRNETLPSDTYFKPIEVRLCDSTKVKICRGLLAHYSKMAASMVSQSSMAAPKEMKLEMLDIHQFDTLIAYLQTGCTKLITKENAIALLYVADYLQIPGLQLVCEQFLLSIEDPLITIQLIQFTKIHQNKVLVMVLE